MTFSIASHAYDFMVTRPNVQINAYIRQQSCENEETIAFLEKLLQNFLQGIYSVYTTLGFLIASLTTCLPAGT